ncbi:MAG: tRNA dihydrouridine synthase DusB [Prevotellaceae bacterium]|jgi:nifR3 family TIM-barrel protein|nr:tRNA dihydrouridine synthase DusB [Prevotellaceae bacterium]
MVISKIDLGARPLLLAPMDEITDPSFRYVCKMYGAAMMYTEFVSSDGLVRDVEKTRQKLAIYDSERPIGIQLYGHLIDAMVESARRAAETHPDVIDINFGCPMKKIANRGAGSGMMREPEKMIEMTRLIVRAVPMPVTVKTRLGWDDDSKTIVELAERLQDVGIAAIAIHGRTRAQMYKGVADWTLIGAVKNNPRMHIPVIGNGDIKTPHDAFTAFERYGVDGVMIGRAAIGRPWLFREITHYLTTGDTLPDMPVPEKVALAKLHLQKSIEHKGQRVGILEFRRHLNHYFKFLDNFKETRLRLLTSTDLADLHALLDYIQTRWGDAGPAPQPTTTSR